jgi:copper chaperone CopZ
MKAWISLVVLLLVVGCLVQETPASNGYGESAQRGSLAILELEIYGMTCPSCALGVEAALKQIDGVIDAEVVYDEGRGRVIYDSSAVGEDEILEGVKPFRAVVVARGKT